ncbi:hypothetical protein [Streptomyces pactum]|uniref:hypothetical protein n=1 Tax=Streptomyces pactum TaxID=68249 RepID=UPI0039081701
MPTPFRRTEPPPPEAATGRVAEVYAQAARNFGIQGPAPFVVLSSAPALVAPAWALTRESLIAGPGTGGADAGRRVAGERPSGQDGPRPGPGAPVRLRHRAGTHRVRPSAPRGLV